jgi:hypothetical protein
MRSQWQCLLQNLGHWQGSFTYLSRSGEIEKDVRSLTILEGQDNNQKMHQEVHLFYSELPEPLRQDDYKLELTITRWDETRYFLTMVLFRRDLCN